MKKYLFLSLFFIFAVSAFSQQQKTSGTSPSRELHPPPVPYFFITGLCLGDTTHFINKTASGVLYFSWNITNDKGDTIYHSSNTNLSYYFKKRGFYRVSLTADNGHVVTKTRTIQVDTLTKAHFVFRN